MSATPLRYTSMSGAENLFAVIDGFEDRVPEDPASVAVALCSSDARARNGVRPDGLILVERARDADCAMRIYNADGSRAEACGNGLRCAAKLVADRGYVAGDRFTVHTDVGVRECHVDREDGLVVKARVQMGRARMVSAEESLDVGSHSVTAALVDMGNPHCVLVVDDERSAPVATLGPVLERHPRFARGTNVGFLALRSDGAFLRVWERGVGETRACGSGACAAAYVAVVKSLASWPVRLTLPGGELCIDADASGELTLSGPVAEHGSFVARTGDAAGRSYFIEAAPPRSEASRARDVDRGART